MAEFHVKNLGDPDEVIELPGLRDSRVDAGVFTVSRGVYETGWRALPSGHFVAARDELERYGGREVKTTGDGLLATFDGAGQAIRCAAAS